MVKINGLTHSSDGCYLRIPPHAVKAYNRHCADAKRRWTKPATSLGIDKTPIQEKVSHDPSFQHLLAFVDSEILRRSDGVVRPGLVWVAVFLKSILRGGVYSHSQSKASSSHDLSGMGQSKSGSSSGGQGAHPSSGIRVGSGPLHTMSRVANSPTASP